MFCGCEDNKESFAVNEEGSSITIKGDSKISSFLTKLTYNISDTIVEKLSLEFTSLTNNKKFTFEGRVNIKDNTINCNIHIPTKETLADSDYILRFIFDKDILKNYKFHLSIKDEMVCKVSVQSLDNYASLRGKGTPENPYKISNTDDFLGFLISISDDPTAGKGLYFAQTDNIIAPLDSGADGVGYYGEQFAGNYDGKGFNFKFSYIGNKDDVKYQNVGMFSILKNGAYVKNLSLTYNISGANANVGGIAGQSSGSVKLTNIILDNCFINDSNECIGGLIGCANRDKSSTNNIPGKIELEDISINLIISANNKLGGVIGSATGVDIDLKNVKSALFLPIKGKSNVGGMIGYYDGERIYASECALSHSVSAEDSEIMILTASSTNCGGIIGNAIIRKALNFEYIVMDMPIGSLKDASENIGGIIGNLTLAGCEYINFKNCQVMKQGGINGKNSIGGFVGNIQNSGSLVPINFIGRMNSQYSDIISNGNYVGGIFGTAQKIKIDPVSIVEIKCDITISGSGSCVGGFAGRLYDSDIAVSNKFAMSKSMQINGSKEAGGFVGYSTRNRYSGETKVDFNYNILQNKEDYPERLFSGIINTQNVSGGVSIGGFIGKSDNDSQISGITVGATVYGKNSIGGLVGYLLNTKRIENCVTMGNIIKGSSNDIGGMIGLMDSESAIISNVISYSSVESGNDNAGGIIGNISACSSITNAVNAGSVSGYGNTGGIAGINAEYCNISITNCANFGAITGKNKLSGSNGIGGIIGWVGHKVRITSCSNHGRIKSNSSVFYKGIGGITGVLGIDPSHTYSGLNNCYVSMCTNNGTISGVSKSAEHLGGIVGYMEEGDIPSSANDYTHTMKLYDCLNMGIIESESKSDNGAILGLESNYTDVYRHINIGSVKYGDGGIGASNGSFGISHGNIYSVKGSSSTENKDGWLTGYLTDSNKSSTSTYKNFDFNKTWIIDISKNQGYPYLRSAPFQFTRFN